MAEIDAVTIIIITTLNTAVAIVVKEVFDIFKDWRARLREEIRKRNGMKSEEKEEIPREPLMLK